MNMDAQRINWIDWAKALGILLVVMGHSNYDVPHLSEMIDMFHMPLFFVISGYLFKPQKSYSGLALLSWKRYVLPFILYNLLFFATTLCTKSVKAYMGIEVDWNESIVKPFIRTITGQAWLPDGPTWFLLALVWCRFITQALHSDILIWKKVLILVLCLAVLVAHSFTGGHYPYCLECGCAGFIWFELGYMLKMNKEKFNVPKWLWAIMIPICFVGSFVVLINFGRPIYVTAQVNGLMGIIGTGLGLLSFFGVCKLLDGVKSKLVVWVSSASISVMCLHTLIQVPINMAIHYQYHIFVTLLGDIGIVLILTAIYPLMKRFVPALTGGR